MSSQIKVLIRELLYGPVRRHSERATPEHIERNKREIAIQNEINERAWRNARADDLVIDPSETTDQGEKQ